MIPLFICVGSSPQVSLRAAVIFHAHFYARLHILIWIAKKEAMNMGYRNDEPADCGDLDDWIFRDEEYEVSRR